MLDQNTLTLLLGPLGLTAGLLFLVYLFVSERVIPKGRLDDQKTATREALDIARQANSALDRMADAVEARNRLDSERVQLETERLRVGNGRRQG